MSDINLAIVLPAYKLTFFERSLNSIASQTNCNFTLYIGDDNSPEELYSIVKTYESKINIVYKKFEKNYGAISLSKQWERCVELTKEEDWIWVFSDDDIMSNDCVELFTHQLKKSSETFDVYRFNCSIIDDVGMKISTVSNYPEIQTSLDFLISRLSYQHHSYISNYIFSRSAYVRNNGFVEFQAAWAADDASWILFGQQKKIFTINRGEVMWRQSSINISGNIDSKSNRRKKYIGTQQFIKWIYDWAHKNNLYLDDRLVFNWFYIMLQSIGYKKVNWQYFKSIFFCRIFWKRSIFYHLQFLAKKYS